MKKILGIVLVFLLGFAAGIFWYRDSGHEVLTDRLPGGQDGRSIEIPADTDDSGVTYADLRIREGDYGMFAGTVTLTNHEDHEVSAFVRVHIYDGSENVGDLLETTSMKPGTTANVDLSSLNKYTDFTDATIEVLP